MDNELVANLVGCFSFLYTSTIGDISQKHNQYIVLCSNVIRISTLSGFRGGFSWYHSVTVSDVKVIELESCQSCTRSVASSEFIVLLWYFIYLCNVCVDSGTTLTSFCSVYRLRHIRIYVIHRKYTSQVQAFSFDRTLYITCVIFFFPKVLFYWNFDLLVCCIHTDLIDILYMLWNLFILVFGDLYILIYLLFFFIHTLKFDWFILI